MTDSSTQSRLPVVHSHALIFEGAWAGGLVQKTTTVTLSAFFWGIWLTMWAPLLTYLFWLTAPFWGVTTIMDAKEDSLPVLALLTAVGMALGATLVMAGALQWAFGSVRARPAVTPNVTLKELADRHQLEESTLLKSWVARRLVVHHHDDSSISHIECE